MPAPGSPMHSLFSLIHIKPTISWDPKINCSLLDLNWTINETTCSVFALYASSQPCISAAEFCFSHEERRGGGKGMRGEGGKVREEQRSGEGCILSYNWPISFCAKDPHKAKEQFCE